MNKWIIIFYGCFLFSCATKQSKPFVTRDYVTVGKMMDSIQPPYVIDIANNSKHLVFIGCDHNNDSSHAQYGVIERYANSLQPQVSFNEGGQIPDSIHYTSKNEAAFKDGETGVLKYYSDKLGIKMLNGDLPFKVELPLVLQKQTIEDLYVYYIMERFAVPYHYGAYGKQSFDSVFAKNALPYLLKNGLPLSPSQQSFNYFKQLYKQTTKQNFDINNFDLEAFDYVNDHCHFCAVGRTSKMTRDSVLLSKIETAFKTNDRVLVTFGHGHALALEPALRQLMSQQ
jgi:hypothetical protein